LVVEKPLWLNVGGLEMASQTQAGLKAAGIAVFAGVAALSVSWWLSGVLPLVPLVSSAADSPRAAQAAYPGPGAGLAPKAQPLATPPPRGPSPTPSPPVRYSSVALSARDAIVRRDGITVDSLVIAEDTLHEYPGLGRSYQNVTIVEGRRGGKTFKMSIDPKTGQMEEASVVEEAERRSIRDRVGKMSPALADHLKNAVASDVVDVGIWVLMPLSPAEQQATAYSQLVAAYPAAKEALEKGGNPFAVADPDTLKTLHLAYARLLSATSEPAAKPLMAELSARGFPVGPVDGAPTFLSRLPRRSS
jgi:hypothetical protein